MVIMGGELGEREAVKMQQGGNVEWGHGGGGKGWVSAPDVRARSSETGPAQNSEGEGCPTTKIECAKSCRKLTEKNAV